MFQRQTGDEHVSVQLSLRPEASCSNVQPHSKEKMAALCSSPWSVARSYRDTRLHNSESWGQLAVSPRITCRIDFSFLATVFTIGGNGFLLPRGRHELRTETSVPL